jgi:hypothetical protein
MRRPNKETKAGSTGLRSQGILLFSLLFKTLKLSIYSILKNKGFDFFEILSSKN